MKLRGILIIVAVVCIAIIAAYFIPVENNVIDQKIFIKTTVNSANKYLVDNKRWNAWWPKNNVSPKQNLSNTSFIYKNISYTPGNPVYNAVSVVLAEGDKNYNGNLVVLPVSKDSILLDWSIEINRSNNLLKKLWSVEPGKQIKANTIELLDSIKSFLEDNVKIYQIPITQAKVADTMLIATRFSSVTYPPTSLIYQNIEKLQRYVTKNNAAQTNPPMLHVMKDSSAYEAMVAIPINKKIADSEDFVTKKMFPGKILITEVKGGTYSTMHAMQQLEAFISDYSIGSPAIPYESLITNRKEESDTSKWLTRLSYPIY